MAARFPNRSGGEAAANSRATSGERGPVAGNGLAQSLAAIARRDRGPVRFGRKEPDEKDTSRFRAATARTAAIDRADAGRTGGGESGRGTISENVSGDGRMVAFAGGDRRRWGHYHRNRCDEQRVVFFFNDTATTEIYTLSLHDALPIYRMPHLLLDRVDQLIAFLFHFSRVGKETR